MNLFRGIARLLHEVDEAVFPSNIYCLCCGSMIDRSRLYSLCDDCIGKFHWNLGPTCERCGKALPEVTDSGGGRQRLCYDCMVKGFSCLTYGLHERELMMDLKYGGMGYVAKKCGDMMFDRIEEEIRSGFFAPENAPADVIVPVPVSDERMRRRGYNQSALMAGQLMRRWREFIREERGASDLFAAPVLCEALERTRKTRMLRSLSPAERALELAGAFRVKRGFRGKIRGKRVLLIDDIYTTGATADACSQALLDAGASEVLFLSWASGGNRRPSEL